MEKSILRGFKNSARLEVRGSRLSIDTVLGSRVFKAIQGP